MTRKQITLTGQKKEKFESVAEQLRDRTGIESLSDAQVVEHLIDATTDDDTIFPTDSL